MRMHYRQLTQLRTPDYRLRIEKENIAFKASLFALGQVVKRFATMALTLLHSPRRFLT